MRKKLENNTSGHDWWHAYRVWRNAVYIGKKEEANMLIVELSALLHDIAGVKMEMIQKGLKWQGNGSGSLMRRKIQSAMLQR